MLLVGVWGLLFYSRGSYRLVAVSCFWMLLRVSLVGCLVFNALLSRGCVGEASTESLILAQDERWRRA